MKITGKENFEKMIKTHEIVRKTHCSFSKTHLQLKHTKIYLKKNLTLKHMKLFHCILCVLMLN